MQQSIDPSVARHQALAFETLADDRDLEMRLSPGRHAVHMTLIHYFDMKWLQGPAKGLFDAGSALHGFTFKCHLG
jgi:hypothetical protein